MLAEEVVVDTRLVVVDVTGAAVGLTGVCWRVQSLALSASLGVFGRLARITVKPNHLRSSSGNTSIEWETPVPKKACTYTATISYRCPYVKSIRR